MDVRNKGFTLVEMLAVIALIGILAGVAAPRILDIRMEAKRVASRANAQVLQDAFERAGVSLPDESLASLWSYQDVENISLYLSQHGFLVQSVTDPNVYTQGEGCETVFLVREF